MTLADVSPDPSSAPPAIWDNHACPARDRPDRGLSELARYRAAGVDIVGLNVGDADFPYDGVIALIDDVTRHIANHPQDYLLVRTVEDVAEAKRSGRLGVFLNLEGLYCIGERVDRIEQLARLGVRWTALVYNRANAVGYGVHDDADEGLTPVGRAAVRELERSGVIVCCSHTGYRTAADALEMAEKPMIFSHSNPRAVHDHPRNIPDELIRACAATGGVIGINGVGIFLGENDIGLETLRRHIDHVSELVGPAHVGLGLDYVFDQDELDRELSAGADIWPAAFGYRPGIRFLPPEQLPALREMLLASGYSEAEVAGFMGANWRRVAAACWPASEPGPDRTD